jgi:stage II sporulation protein D
MEAGRLKLLKPIIVLGSILFIVTLLIPTLLVIPFTEKTKGSLVEDPQPQAMTTTAVENGASIAVPVYRTEKQIIEEIPLEQYVVGVVASEMPASFEMEALKAQALAARTYIVQQLLHEMSLRTPEGAEVTDTVGHQVYKDLEDLKKQWGADYSWRLERITEAVNATAGQIITFNGTPIDASFFSTSNGYTENSEDYWSNEFPYLRSVASPWDEKSPKYLSSITIPITEFENKLGVNLSNGSEIGKITSRTEGRRVGSVQIGEKKFTGRYIRDELKLNSSDFNWERKGNVIVITTKGYGHGVGMSQYGANGMAEEGKTYQDIVKYYYQGIEISPVNPYVEKLTAAK